MIETKFFGYFETIKIISSYLPSLSLDYLSSGGTENLTFYVFNSQNLHLLGVRGVHLLLKQRLAEQFLLLNLEN